MGCKSLVVKQLQLKTHTQQTHTRAGYPFLGHAACYKAASQRHSQQKGALTLITRQCRSAALPQPPRDIRDAAITTTGTEAPPHRGGAPTAAAKQRCPGPQLCRQRPYWYIPQRWLRYHLRLFLLLMLLLSATAAIAAATVATAVRPMRQLPAARPQAHTQQPVTLLSQAGSVQAGQAGPVVCHQPGPADPPYEPLRACGEVAERTSQGPLECTRHPAHRQVIRPLLQHQHLTRLIIPHKCDARAQVHLPDTYIPSTGRVQQGRGGVT